MLKHTTFIVLLSAITFSSHSQITFNTIYGTEYREDTYDIITSTRGDYVICGNTFGFGAESEMFILRVDEEGNQQSFSKYFGISGDNVEFIAQRSDSGLVISGSTNSYGLGGRDRTCCCH